MRLWPRCPRRRAEAPIGGEDLQAEVFGLHAEVRAGPLIGMAQGVLLERYAVADADAAFGLPKQASQRHNVPMRVLASAVVTPPPPSAPSPEWFPGRTVVLEALEYMHSHAPHRD
ncbi:ANTAR domain-containing protein [Streptomyces sp. NPDC048419]|uniref:ANTAR domain-containing protein n=1 Tax=Streptomyces sp. NPDC048419 TaxID=3365547 RepID=UPI00371AC3E2